MTRPDQELFQYLSTAFGDTPPDKAMGASYRLTGASINRQTNEIRLDFDGPGTGWTLTSFHDRSRNCMPVRLELKDYNGAPADQLKRVKYAEFKTRGGTIYFPEAIDTTIYYPSDPTVTTVHRHALSGAVQLPGPKYRDEPGTPPNGVPAHALPVRRRARRGIGQYQPGGGPVVAEAGPNRFPVPRLHAQLVSSGYFSAAAATSDGGDAVDVGDAVKGAQPSGPPDYVSYAAWSLGNPVGRRSVDRVAETLPQRIR